MARAYKCDRCGEFYEPQENVSGQFEICEVIATRGIFEHNQKDICPACHKELAEWWNLER